MSGHCPSFFLLCDSEAGLNLVKMTLDLLATLYLLKSWRGVNCSWIYTCPENQNNVGAGVTAATNLTRETKIRNLRKDQDSPNLITKIFTYNWKVLIITRTRNYNYKLSWNNFLNGKSQQIILVIFLSCFWSKLSQLNLYKLIKYFEALNSQVPLDSDINRRTGLCSEAHSNLTWLDVFKTEECACLGRRTSEGPVRRQKPHNYFSREGSM